MSNKEGLLSVISLPSCVNPNEAPDCKKTNTQNCYLKYYFKFHVCLSIRPLHLNYTSIHIATASALKNDTAAPKLLTT